MMVQYVQYVLKTSVYWCACYKAKQIQLKNGWLVSDVREGF